MVLTQRGLPKLAGLERFFYMTLIERTLAVSLACSGLRSPSPGLREAHLPSPGDASSVLRLLQMALCVQTEGLTGQTDAGLSLLMRSQWVHRERSDCGRSSLGHNCKPPRSGQLADLTDESHLLQVHTALILQTSKQKTKKRNSNLLIIKIFKLSQSLLVVKSSAQPLPLVALFLFIYFPGRRGQVGWWSDSRGSKLSFWFSESLDFSSLTCITCRPWQQRHFCI